MHRLQPQSGDSIPLSTTEVGRFSSAFDFQYFNPLQSRVFQAVFHGSDSLVLSAPTGSGKTVVFELAIMHLLLETHTQKHPLAVYIAPIKALCRERKDDWTNRLSPLGVNVIEVTGDSESTHGLSNADLVVTTPEKWDAITRTDGSVVRRTKLLLIDEVHLLGEGRGAVLEALVTRLRVLIATLRVVAVSATIPNLSDVAEWLDVPIENQFIFGPEYRPVPVSIHVHAFDMRDDNAFKFERFLDYKVTDIILRYSQNKPTLVFCSTRQSVIQAARAIMEHIQQRGRLIAFVRDHIHKQSLLALAKRLDDRNLASLVEFGVGFHSGGLSYNDRRCIETAFLNSELQVLCTTSTLAMGVNLPAHLVIVKGTMQYRTCQRSYVPYTRIQLMQMIGRAGRPQFDDSATAVIMTDTASRRQFEQLAHGQEPLDSYLLSHSLAEVLNAEISLGVISSIQSAMLWISNTFLYVRLRKQPHRFAQQLGCTVDDETQVNRVLMARITDHVDKLAALKCVLMSDDGSLLPTDLSSILARYSASVLTLEATLALKDSVTVPHVFKVFGTGSLSDSFPLRNGDKGVLNKLNAGVNKRKTPTDETVKSPYPGRIRDVETKIAVLIQTQLGNLAIEKFSLTNERLALMRQVPRVARFVFNVILHRVTTFLKDPSHSDSDGNLFQALVATSQALSCVETGIWHDAILQTQQLDGIGPKLSMKLSESGFNTIRDVAKSDPSMLEIAAKRRPPFGRKLLDSALQFPRFSLNAHQIGAIQEQVALLSVEFVLSTGVVPKSRRQVVLVVANADNSVVYCRSFYVSSQDIRFQQDITLLRCENEVALVAVLVPSVVGLDFIQTIELAFAEYVSISKSKIRPHQQEAADHEGDSGSISCDELSSPSDPAGDQSKTELIVFSDDSPVSISSKTKITKFEPSQSPPKSPELSTTIKKHHAPTTAFYATPTPPQIETQAASSAQKPSVQPLQQSFRPIQKPTLAPRVSIQIPKRTGKRPKVSTNLFSGAVVSNKMEAVKALQAPSVVVQRRRPNQPSLRTAPLRTEADTKKIPSSSIMHELRSQAELPVKADHHPFQPPLAIQTQPPPHHLMQFGGFQPEFQFLPPQQPHSQPMTMLSSTFNVPSQYQYSQPTQPFLHGVGMSSFSSQQPPTTFISQEPVRLPPFHYPGGTFVPELQPLAGQKRTADEPTSNLGRVGMLRFPDFSVPRKLVVTDPGQFSQEKPRSVQPSLHSKLFGHKSLITTQTKDFTAVRVIGPQAQSHTRDDADILQL